MYQRRNAAAILPKGFPIKYAFFFFFYFYITQNATNFFLNNKQTKAVTQRHNILAMIREKCWELFRE